MTQYPQQTIDALHAAGWTLEEATSFAHAVIDFRDGLPQRQQEAFNAILATARAGAADEDVTGYIGPLLAVGIFTIGEVIGFAVVRANQSTPSLPLPNIPIPSTPEPTRGHDGRPS